MLGVLFAALAQQADRLTLDGAGNTGLARESWSNNVQTDGADALTMQGNSRAYMVKDYTEDSWDGHQYQRFDLRGKTLRIALGST